MGLAGVADALRALAPPYRFHGELMHGAHPRALRAALVGLIVDRLKATLGSLPDLTTEAGRAAWMAEVEPLLTNLRATLTGNLPRARQQLRQILSGPMSATPQHGPEGIAWDLCGLVSFMGWTFDLVTGKGTQSGQVERPLVGRVLNRRVCGYRGSKWCPRGGTLANHTLNALKSLTLPFSATTAGPRR